MSIIYGEYQLAMNYSVEELNQIIDKFIEAQKNEGQETFSYRNLCHYLFRLALSENRLQKENDCMYNNPVMADSDATLVSKLLWERIWEKEIIIDFHESKYASSYHDDTRFCVL